MSVVWSGYDHKIKGSAGLAVLLDCGREVGGCIDLVSALAFFGGFGKMGLHLLWPGGDYGAQGDGRACH